MAKAKEWPPELDAAILEGTLPQTVIAKQFGLRVSQVYGRSHVLKVRRHKALPPGPRRVLWNSSMPRRWLLAKGCIRCGGLKPPSAFRIDQRYGTDGSFRAECSDCDTARAIANRAKDKAAWDAAGKERMHRVQSEVIETARNNGKEWTGPELEVIARTDLSDREKARMLGRTFYAVRHQVTKLNAGDPKTHIKAGLARGVDDTPNLK